MAIYKYTLHKYLKAKSTWIIALISGLLIGFLIGGLLPFQLIDANKSNASTTYTTTVVASIAGVTSFLSIFASVFAGFKAASMYKDEVEDGTFLVMLSKPMKRSTIIFSKWLALQTIIFGYTIFTVLCFALGVLAFDKGGDIQNLDLIGVKTASSQIWLIAGFIALILFVTGTIFSSIGILLSTKLSVGSTIGISIALGIVIPITSLIGAFTKKDEFKTFSNSSLITEEMKLRAISKESAHIPNTPAAVAGAEALKVANVLSDYQKTQEVKDIYKMAISTGDKSIYNYLWVLDLNYQVSQLSSLAYNKAIPDSAKQLAINARTSSSTATPGLSSQKFVSDSVVKAQQAINLIEGALSKFYLDAPQVASVSAQLLNAALAPSVLAGKDVTLSRTAADVLKKAIAGNPKLSALTNAIDASYKIKIKDLMTVITTAYDKSIANLYPAIIDKKYDTNIVPTATDEISKWFSYQVNMVQEELFADLSMADLIAPQGLKVNIKDSISEFSKLLLKLDSPVSSFLVNPDMLKKAAGDELSDKDKNEALKAINNIASPTFNLNAISRADRDAIVNLVAANEAGKLVQVSSVDYVNANWLLLGYLAIAIALVPLAYWVVRKQDFR